MFPDRKSRVAIQKQIITDLTEREGKKAVIGRDKKEHNPGSMLCEAGGPRLLGIFSGISQQLIFEGDFMFY